MCCKCFFTTGIQSDHVVYRRKIAADWLCILSEIGMKPLPPHVHTKMIKRGWTDVARQCKKHWHSLLLLLLLLCILSTFYLKQMAPFKLESGKIIEMEQQLFKNCLKRKTICAMNSSKFCIATWNDNVCDLQLLTRWDKFQAKYMNPMCHIALTSSY